MGTDTEVQKNGFVYFFTKDKDSFEDCLRENDVIHEKNERDRLKKCLQDRPKFKTHSKVLSAYWLPIAINLLQFATIPAYIC